MLHGVVRKCIFAKQTLNELQNKSKGIAFYILKHTFHSSRIDVCDSSYITFQCVSRQTELRLLKHPKKYRSISDYQSQSSDERVVDVVPLSWWDGWSRGRERLRAARGSRRCCVEWRPDPAQAWSVALLAAWLQPVKGSSHSEGRWLHRWPD